MSISSGSFKPVPWGASGATLVGLLALFGADILVLLTMAGFMVLNSNLTFEAAFLMIGHNLQLLFLYYLVARITGLGLAYWFVRHRGGGLDSLGLRAFSLKRAAAVIALGLSSFFVVAVAATFLVERYAPGIDITAEQEVPFMAAQGGELVLAFIALVIIAPVAEEVIFRGLLLPAYAKAAGPLMAVVITSVMFGLVHPPAIAMIMIGIFSLFLSWAYIRTGSLWPAVLLHAGKNLLAFILVAMMGL